MSGDKFPANAGDPEQWGKGGTAKTGHFGQWRPGQSGNPKGTPSGSRLKILRDVDVMLESEVHSLFRTIVEQALAGCTTSQKLIADRVMPPRRDRPVAIDLPPLDTAESVAAASARIAESVAAGELTPSEGEAVAKLVEARRRAIETVELEQRMARIEAAAGVPPSS